MTWEERWRKARTSNTRERMQQQKHEDEEGFMETLIQQGWTEFVTKYY